MDQFLNPYFNLYVTSGELLRVPVTEDGLIFLKKTYKLLKEKLSYYDEFKIEYYMSLDFETLKTKLLKTFKNYFLDPEKYKESMNLEQGLIFSIYEYFENTKNKHSNYEFSVYDIILLSLLHIDTKIDFSNTMIDPKERLNSFYKLTQILKDLCINKNILQYYEEDDQDWFNHKKNSFDLFKILENNKIRFKLFNLDPDRIHKINQEFYNKYIFEINSSALDLIDKTKLIDIYFENNQNSFSSLIDNMLLLNSSKELNPVYYDESNNSKNQELFYSLDKYFKLDKTKLPDNLQGLFIYQIERINLPTFCQNILSKEGSFSSRSIQEFNSKKNLELYIHNNPFKNNLKDSTAGQSNSNFSCDKYNKKMTFYKNLDSKNKKTYGLIYDNLPERLSTIHQVVFVPDEDFSAGMDSHNLDQISDSEYAPNSQILKISYNKIDDIKTLIKDKILSFDLKDKYEILIPVIDEFDPDHKLVFGSKNTPLVNKKGLEELFKKIDPTLKDTTFLDILLTKSIAVHLKNILDVNLLKYEDSLNFMNYMTVLLSHLCNDYLLNILLSDTIDIEIRISYGCYLINQIAETYNDWINISTKNAQKKALYNVYLLYASMVSEVAYIISEKEKNPKFDVTKNTVKYNINYISKCINKVNSTNTKIKNAQKQIIESSNNTSRPSSPSSRPSSPKTSRSSTPVTNVINLFEPENKKQPSSSPKPLMDFSMLKKASIPTTPNPDDDTPKELIDNGELISKKIKGLRKAFESMPYSASEDSFTTIINNPLPISNIPPEGLIKPIPKTPEFNDDSILIRSPKPAPRSLKYTSPNKENPNKSLPNDIKKELAQITVFTADLSGITGNIITDKPSYDFYIKHKNKFNNLLKHVFFDYINKRKEHLANLEDFNTSDPLAKIENSEIICNLIKDSIDDYDYSLIKIFNTYKDQKNLTSKEVEFINLSLKYFNKYFLELEKINTMIDDAKKNLSDVLKSTNNILSYKKDTSEINKWTNLLEYSENNSWAKSDKLAVAAIFASSDDKSKDYEVVRSINHPNLTVGYFDKLDYSETNLSETKKKIDKVAKMVFYIIDCFLSLDPKEFFKRFFQLMDAYYAEISPSFLQKMLKCNLNQFHYMEYIQYIKNQFLSDTFYVDKNQVKNINPPKKQTTEEYMIQMGLLKDLNTLDQIINPKDDQIASTSKVEESKKPNSDLSKKLLIELPKEDDPVMKRENKPQPDTKVPINKINYSIPVNTTPINKPLVKSLDVKLNKTLHESRFDLKSESPLKIFDKNNINFATLYFKHKVSYSFNNGVFTPEETLSPTLIKTEVIQDQIYKDLLAKHSKITTELELHDFLSIVVGYIPVTDRYFNLMKIADNSLKNVIRNTYSNIYQLTKTLIDYLVDLPEDPTSTFYQEKNRFWDKFNQEFGLVKLHIKSLEITNSDSFKYINETMYNFNRYLSTPEMLDIKTELNKQIKEKLNSCWKLLENFFHDEFYKLALVEFISKIPINNNNFKTNFNKKMVMELISESVKYSKVVSDCMSEIKVLTQILEKPFIPFQIIEMLIKDLITQCELILKKNLVSNIKSNFDKIKLEMKPENIQNIESKVDKFLTDYNNEIMKFIQLKAQIIQGDRLMTSSLIYEYFIKTGFNHKCFETKKLETLKLDIRTEFNKEILKLESQKSDLISSKNNMVYNMIKDNGLLPYISSIKHLYLTTVANLNRLLLTTQNLNDDSIQQITKSVGYCFVTDLIYIYNSMPFVNLDSKLTDLQESYYEYNQILSDFSIKNKSKFESIKNNFDYLITLNRFRSKEPPIDNIKILLIALEINYWNQTAKDKIKNKIKNKITTVDKGDIEFRDIPKTIFQNYNYNIPLPSSMISNEKAVFIKQTSVNHIINDLKIDFS